MLDYNRSTLQEFNSHLGWAKDTEIGLSDYQEWASRLHTYAARVRAPELAAHARRIADLGDTVVRVVDDAGHYDDPDPFGPGGPAPPWLLTYTAATKAAQGDFDALNAACPAGR